MKKKSLEDLMLVYAENRRQGNRARNHAVFLAYREQVIELHTNGWKYVDIWRAMREDGIIGFSYSSFLRYARSLGAPSALPSPQPPAPQPAPAKPADASGLPAWPKPAQAGVKPIALGSPRGDMPVFGKNHTPRDPDSF